MSKPTEKKKILIVDDDQAVIKSLGGMLSSQNFEVVTAKDGSEGLAKALNESPQLIVLDLEMPVLNGMDMLKELRESGDFGKKVPVIILTNFDTSEKILQGIVENEPSFYFLKSKTNPSEIIDRIKEKLA